ncbi:MAG: tetratricopeptide repeat protein, partial [Gemmatimonadetes bacterium]|nr:tetratricopeptide repeat protein [Gemmatimonadota bacterium]
HRLNNRGVALLEQLRYAEAERAFRSALDAAPSLAQARVNLSLALLYQQQLDAAADEAARAAGLWPAAPQPLYVQGLVARAQGRNDLARLRFEDVRRKDDSDAGTRVQLAQIALEERRYDDAVEALRPVVATEPHHVTASYVLGLALVRAGKSEGQQWLDRAQALRQAGTGVTLGTGYLEQGRFAEAMSATGTEATLVHTAPARATFSVMPLGAPSLLPAPSSPFGHSYLPSDLDEAGAASLAAGLGGGVTLLDADGDGDLDVFTASAGSQQLWRNDGAVWNDATAAAGLQAVPAASTAIGAVAADYDNDGRPDVFVLRFGTSSLYHNEGGGRFRDVTREAALPPYPYLAGAAAFGDLDHDGDLDLVIAGLADIDATGRLPGPARLFPQEFVAAPWQVVRNNRNGSFTDVTRETGFDTRGRAVAIVPADFDNRRDLDLLLVYVDAPPVLLSNQRDGTFRDIAAQVGLETVGGATAVATGDVNHDDWPDLFFAGRDRGTLALSDGQGRFTLTSGPPEAGALHASQAIDYDGDGLLDLIGWADGRPRVWRHLGLDWRDETTGAIPQADSSRASRLDSSRGVAAADLDGDGDTDMVSRGAGAVWLWRNAADARHVSVRVTLQGRVSNASGVGAKVQVRAGSLWSRRDVSAATPAVAASDLVFGLGPRRGADAVRVLWPSGIVQTELPAADAGSNAATLSGSLRVEELDRKPSSCPLLFTWSGERFEFVTDFLGAGEMGAWVGPGAYAHPDPVELVRIGAEQLQPRQGRLELRLTNELEEVLFLDRVQLMAVDHPHDTEVFPDAGMTSPPKPDRLLAVRRPRPPAAVRDDAGRDMMGSLARIDRVFADGFRLAPIRGYAAPHALMIDLGTTDADVVLLTGWTDYAFSSDNVAAHQAGLQQQPPILEVKTRSGL